jgi:hypothetical protein
MKKTLISLFALAFAFFFGTAQAAKHEAPAAKTAADAKKDPCAESKPEPKKDGGDMKKKTTEKKAAEPAKK